MISILSKYILRKIIFIFVLFNILSAYCYAQTAHGKYVVLIGGLGGTEEYREKFHQYLYQSREAFINKFKVPEENIVTLAGFRSPEDKFIDQISTAENIRNVFTDLSGKVTEDAEVIIILYGHGSFDGKNAVLNIPRQDLKDTDYAELILPLNTKRVVFINTASCSGPFVAVLSASNRIIVTATRSGRERNETVFPKFFISALNDDAADLDKNGDLSWLEVFQYASRETSKWFKDEGLLATEHALLEDSGDKSALQIEDLNSSQDGNLARTTYLKSESDLYLSRTVNGKARALLLKKEEIEDRIGNILSEKEKYNENEYYNNLEPLFIRLALLNDSLEQMIDTSEVQ
jgi:hypothetical protein